MQEREQEERMERMEEILAEVAEEKYGEPVNTVHAKKALSEFLNEYRQTLIAEGASRRQNLQCRPVDQTVPSPSSTTVHEERRLMNPNLTVPIDGAHVHLAQ
mmetsp:Transcript_23078/g.32510  ORF Transcript_23078/g.32510 Transcript_23078/m.32510 type:complete len:102 (+) Transcript_23078:315-620(+)